MSSGFGPYIVELPGGMQISQTVTTTWYIMLGLIIFAYFAGRNLKNRASGFQLVIEALVGGINGLTKQTMGEHNMKFAPYMGTLILFILTANLSGLLGFRPPTADANTTLALSCMTFFMIHFFAIRKKGIGTYLKGYTEPFFLLLPLNVVGELATPISLGFRLFGNITGGMVIMTLLYGALDGFTKMLLGIDIPILQVGVPAVLHIYFDVFSGVLQSFIFTMLTMVFISIATD